MFGLNFFQNLAFNALGAWASGQLKSMPADRLNRWLVHLGEAFGPPDIRHFSQLSPSEQASLLLRVPILKTNHSDWIKPFQWVPRKLTVWVGPAPTMADVIDGEVTELKPIPLNGEWYVLRGYTAATTAEGIHNRLGWRYDDVDNYFELSLSVKRVN